MEIIPYDSLFFRDGKPFNKNSDDNNYHDGLYTPYPSTMYGAIFSMLLRTLDRNKLHKEFEFIKRRMDDREINKILSNCFRLKRIYIYDDKRSSIYVKSPSDISFNDYKGRNLLPKYYMLDKDIKQDLKHNISHKLDLQYLLELNDEYERATNHYISMNDYINHYISAGDKKSLKNVLIKEVDIFLKDRSIGISIDKGTVEEGMLYRLNKTVLNKGYSYIAEIEYDSGMFTINKDNDYRMLLGGEGKAARCSLVDFKYDNDFIKQIYKDTELEDNKLKMILTSHSIFTNDEPYFPELEGFDVLGIVNSRAAHIGGFSMINGQRSAYKANIPGTVYVLKSKTPVSNLYEADKLLKKEINNCSINSFKGFNQYLLAKF